MGMRCRVLAGWLAAVWLFCLSGCSSSSSSSSSGTGALFVSTQGDSLVSAFSIDLTGGTITANGKGVATGTMSSAMIMAPSGNALFIANSATNDISAYTVSSNGTLTAGSGTQATGMTPVSMAMDSGGKFLFVANQGQQSAPASGTISVFSVQDATLTEVMGSPFPTAAPLASSGTGPTGVAVTPDGKFLYVANQFDATVSQYSIDASGALTQESTVGVGTAPSALGITPNGGFLYVGNAGSSNVSAFAICGQVVTSCADPTSPDGRLSVVPNSPFPAGLGPGFIVSDTSGKFLYVVDRQSNQISQYKISTGTGELTTNTSPFISTGLNPVWAAVRNGTTVVTATGGTKNFLYVANLGASTIQTYSFDSTVGLLGLVGGPVSTGGSPSAVAVK
jgi:6-phosphogluconolactonase (cycloisomerase 2 family)